MKTYCVRLSGSAGLQSMEFERQEMNDIWIKGWAERMFPNYYPVFYRAEVWEKSEIPDEIPGRSVASYVMRVVAVQS